MLPKLQHIVVLMMENHSFDDHLGMLGRGDGSHPRRGRRPVELQPQPGRRVCPIVPQPQHRRLRRHPHLPELERLAHQPGQRHQHGLRRGLRRRVDGLLERQDLPFYYSLASHFPIGDRYFCSVMAQTYPNRRFLIAATALGNIATNGSGISHTDAPNGTIFDRLDHHGISWKDYYPDAPTCGLFLPNFSTTRPTARSSTSSSSSPTRSRATSPRSRSSTPTSTSRRRTATSRSARRMRPP